MSPEEIKQMQAESGSERKHGRWSRAEMLLALLADRLEASNFLQRLHDAPDKATRRKILKDKPKPLPRPGVDDRRELPPLSEEGRSFLEAMRRNRGGYTPPKKARSLAARTPEEIKRMRAIAEAEGTTDGR